jgi:hypothetical protein
MSHACVATVGSSWRRRAQHSTQRLPSVVAVQRSCRQNAAKSGEPDYLHRRGHRDFCDSSSATVCFRSMISPDPRVHAHPSATCYCISYVFLISSSRLDNIDSGLWTIRAECCASPSCPCTPILGYVPCMVPSS